MSALTPLPPDVEKVWITVDKAQFPCISHLDLARFTVLIKGGAAVMNFIHFLSTVSTGLSTGIKDNFPSLTSTFTDYPQIRATPITTIFIYNYLSSPSERGR